ncbi:SIR2 family protein [Aurantibacillus circumpalustris]|uniref:SIR2 family protein n=1 Tax=Aurantibacillus circumpalustris TaxID=3036359 RepID=UPI00295ADE6A|nr:SIR2 family protein [Aurantibacillus circumpalustris]
MSEIVSRPLFLFGNGLSIALSHEFALRNITEKFIKGLQGDERAFFHELCGKENLNFEDFESNFAQLEAAYSSLVKYRTFIESETGVFFLNKFHLTNPNLKQHEEVIKSLYDKYIFQILSLIQGNVTKAGIAEKLNGFTTFLKSQLNECEKGFIFTLNYDLLAEAILLEEIGTERITDFCSPSGHFKGSDISKYDFDPAMNDEKFGEDYNKEKVELHHLHGSLSLFYDHSRNKTIKFKNDDILTNGIYKKIEDEKWTLYPAIITGGGKSLKVTEYPFEFYYRNLKDISTYAKFTKFYIVGYSFRDEHINDLIKRWISAVVDYQNGLLIVDFKTDELSQKNFKLLVKKSLKLLKEIPETCFEFRGVNLIHDVIGAVKKPKKKK